jgi:hypothetical protein
MHSAWKLVADDAELRLVVENICWPCQRAYLLFQE